MIIAARIALAWLLFVGLAYADGTFGVGQDGLTFAVTNGIGKKGSGGGGGGATGYTWAGPSTGTAGSPSTNFTVTASGGTFTGSQTITISDGTKGGTITPSVGSPGTSTVTVTPTNGSSSFTFTYTAVLGDAITLTGTNGQAWSNPSALPYTGAVTYTMTGPSTGTAGSASSNFTVSMPAGTKFSGSDTVTIADGSKGGTFTPSVGGTGVSTVTVTPTANATSFTYTYTAVLGDTVTLAPTNAQSWTNPSSLTYTGAVTYTATGPSSGKINAASTNFTVSMPAGVQFSGTDTITVADGSQGGTITPSVGSPGTSSVTVTPAASATNFTFTYKPMVVATPVTMAFTNAQSWTNPSSISYTSSPNCSQSGTLLARMDGSENQVAVDALICGMVSDVTYTLMKGLYVFATNSTANANLNWAGSSFTLSKNGSVTFNANQGYTGDGSTGYFTTNLNPTAASIAGNSISFGTCVVGSRTVGNGGNFVGSIDGSSNNSRALVLNGSTNFFITFLDAGTSVANSNAQGSWIVTKTSATVGEIYKNGSAFSAITTSGSSQVNNTYFALAYNNNGTPLGFDSDQTAYVFIGTGLTSTNVTNIYNRLHTYLQAVGETTAC